MKILLGSNSPRRNELLDGLGYQFTKVAIDCEEDFEDVELIEVAAYLARKKSMAYSNLIQDEILITADTVVFCDQQILNKPENQDDALRMLRILSGKKHSVITGVCLRTKEKCIVFDVKTEVEFSDFTENEMLFYVKNYYPMDKAGSYGIQEWIGLAKVNCITGCFYNVMGLPTSKLFSMLTSEFDLYPKNFK